MASSRRSGGSLDDHTHAGLRSWSGPTCRWLQVHLEALCFPCTHCVWDANGRDAHLEAKKACPGQETPESRRDGGQKCPLEAGPRSITLVRCGALCPQLLWGFQGSQSRRGLHEEDESRPCPVHPWAITQACSPATCQSRLHLGLARRILKADGTEEDALTRPLPTEHSSPWPRWLNTGHYLTIMPSWRRSQENSN